MNNYTPLFYMDVIIHAIDLMLVREFMLVKVAPSLAVSIWAVWWVIPSTKPNTCRHVVSPCDKNAWYHYAAIIFQKYTCRENGTTFVN